MSGRPPDDAAAEGLDREQLQLVIRRAAELYAAEAESGERLAPAEVLRIAEELGLPSRHVRQALYELPLERPAGGLLDRWYGPADLIVTRSLPADPRDVLARLESHLTGREYLQPRRRRDQHLVLVPAADTVSSLARAFRRPRSRHYLAHARSLEVAARPLDAHASHVQLHVDLSELRGGYVAGGIVGGTAAGAAAGTGLFFAVAIGLTDLAGLATSTAAGAGAIVGVTGLAATVRVSLRVAAERFRRRVADARTEVEGLLDRVERGEALEPPPSPVRKWLLGG